jgi:class 3 adenylate cyclase
VIVITDVSKFTNYFSSHPIRDSEILLLYLDELITRACRKNSGIVRVILADGHILTFSDSENALQAVAEICEGWIEFTTKNKIPCGYKIGINKGDVYIFRAHLYGESINRTARLSYMKHIQELGDIRVLASQGLINDLPEGKWKSSFELFQEGIYSLKLHSKKP